MYSARSTPPAAPELPAPQGSWVTRVGTAVGAGALAAMAASVPAAARVANEGAGRFGPSGVWLALAASSLVPTILAVIIVRGARRGSSAFAGEDAAPRALGLLVWILSTTLAMVVFGAALRATTHHHALAGSTFALVGLGIAVLLAFVARRTAAIASRWHPLVQRLSLGGAALGLSCLLLYLCLKVSRTAPATVGLVVDVLAYGIAVGLTSRMSLARSRVFAVLGPPLAAIVLGLGVSSLRGAPRVTAAVHAHALLLRVPVDCTAQLVRKR